MTGEKAALAMVGVGEGSMEAMIWNTSPTTMERGGGDPARVAQLRRNRLQGAVISILLLGGVSYFVGREDPTTGAVLFSFGLGSLALFWYESERALRKAESNGSGASDVFGADSGY